jgi:hypothetical protein
VTNSNRRANPRCPLPAPRALHDRTRVAFGTADRSGVAGAAMSRHDDGLVLGGAATLAPHRGSGAQTALLRAFHAALATRDLGRRGVKLAAATAAPGSPSLRNMACAGFAGHPRRAWRSRLSE